MIIYTERGERGEGKGREEEKVIGNSNYHEQNKYINRMSGLEARRAEEKQVEEEMAERKYYTVVGSLNAMV